MYLFLKDIMKKKRNYQLTYHPTQLNRKPETKLEKMYIYNNMIQTGTTIENICTTLGMDIVILSHQIYILITNQL